MYSVTWGQFIWKVAFGVMNDIDVPDLSSSGISFGENSFGAAYSVQSSSRCEILI